MDEANYIEVRQPLRKPCSNLFTGIDFRSDNQISRLLAVVA